MIIDFIEAMKNAQLIEMRGDYCTKYVGWAGNELV